MSSIRSSVRETSPAFQIPGFGLSRFFERIYAKVRALLGVNANLDGGPNFRLWLEADIHPHSDLRPLHPRKQTFGGLSLNVCF